MAWYLLNTSLIENIFFEAIVEPEEREIEITELEVLGFNLIG